MSAIGFNAMEKVAIDMDELRMKPFPIVPIRSSTGNPCHVISSAYPLLHRR